MLRLMIVLCSAVAVLGAHRSHAVELLAPFSDVSIGEDHLVLVGQSADDTVYVSLDGAPRIPFPVEGGYFHAMIAVNFGLHALEITDESPEHVSIQVLAGPKIDRSYASTFTEYKFHGSEPAAECISCHDPTAAVRDIASQTGWCMSCHPDVPTKFTRHAGDQPVACGDCHQVNLDLTLSKPASHADANPCYGCHDDKIGEFAQDYVHGPVAGGACTICHDPHGSDFAHTLNQPAGMLCLSCHDMDPTLYEVEHQPVVNGQCVDCHDPHATMNRWVLVRSSEDLCFPCHGNGGELAEHQHPYNVKPKLRLEVRLKLTPEGRLECLSCHEAHGGSKRAMLRSPTKDLCVGCHPRHW